MPHPELTQFGIGNVTIFNSGFNGITRYDSLNSHNTTTTTTTASHNDSSGSCRDRIAISNNPSNRAFGNGFMYGNQLGRLSLPTFL
jgi:hypothetical protein